MICNYKTVFKTVTYAPIGTLVLPFVLQVFGPIHEKRNIESNKTARIDFRGSSFHNVSFKRKVFYKYEKMLLLF